MSRAPTNAAEPPIDLYAPIKQRIAARNWAAIHVASDRRQPVEIEPRRKGWWK
jgi:hypothetical protein